MTIDELMKRALGLFPDAEVLEDDEGQLVIHTNLREDARGELISHLDYMDEAEGDEA